MKKNKGKTLCIIIYVLTVIVGAAGGYLLYRFAECGAGSCSVTSNPYFGAALGAIFGFLLGTLLCPQRKAEE